MRTPSWEASPGALAALLQQYGPMAFADCYTITLKGGTVLRWTSAELPVALGARTFTPAPGITRNRIAWRAGISTDVLSLTLTDIAATTVLGMPLPVFARSREFADAVVELERAFFAPAAFAPTGAYLWFVGDVQDVSGNRYAANVKVASFTARLSVSVPRDVTQASCKNQFGDAYCQANKATYTVAGNATTTSDTNRGAFGHSLAQPAGWGTLGLITFTGGANAGQSRTCKEHTASQLVALQPWGFPVAVGDAYTLLAGCDRTSSTCENKFARLQFFRAEDLIPAPETVF